MERLTCERVNGIKEGYWSAEKKETLIARLAEYENTGKTPEVLYVTLAKRNTEGWWYIDMECDSLNYDLNPEDYEGKEDLGCPWVEVLAWKMIPRGCGNERN